MKLEHIRELEERLVEFRELSFNLLNATDAFRGGHDFFNDKLIDEYPFEYSFDEQLHKIINWIDLNVDNLYK